MTKIRIIKTKKTSMQSGKGLAGQWMIKYLGSHQQKDPLMGWYGGSNTQKQIKLGFKTLDEAKAFAHEHHLEIISIDHDQGAPKPKIKNYADNFSNNRNIPWTH